MIRFFSGIFSDRRILWFTLVWLVVNLIQSAFTELANDEAYYWLYAKYLDIGYYDHPPMIALMIKAGGWLLKGELGVRLITVLLSAASIPLLYDLCGRKNFRLFVLMFCACTVFQVYGFIAVPDSPLLFFTVLFFFAYREYLKNDNWINTLFVGITVACLLYSKYHGLLIIFFTVISNFSLFKRKSFYVIILAAIGFYSPHILWQIHHDYPSYQYHVLNKSLTAYNFKDSLEFFGATILVAGPFLGITLLIGFVKNKKRDQVLRALRFSFLGFCIFFFFSTFNSAIEANWMAAAVVPLFIVASDFISENEKLRIWAMRLSIVSLALFCFARVNLMCDLVPLAGSKVLPEFYGWSDWAQQVKEQARGCPVVILNSYQRASKYSFYAGEDALSLNNMEYRRNQFDIWPIADQMQGKRVALIRNWDEWQGDVKTFETPRGKTTIMFIDSFRCYTKYRIGLDKDWYTFPRSSEVEIHLEFFDEDPSSVNYHNSRYAPLLVCRRYYYADFDNEIVVDSLDPDELTTGMQKTIRIKTPDKPGPYYLRFGFKSGWMSPNLNSRLVRMDIE